MPPAVKPTDILGAITAIPDVELLESTGQEQ
jgi:hypothetical protein